MPLEGRALAIATAMVGPSPVKGKPGPTPSRREPRTPEQGAADRILAGWSTGFI
jgi:hypothetical protein